MLKNVASTLPFGSSNSFGQEERIRNLENMLRRHQVDFDVHRDYRVGQMEFEYDGGLLVRSILYADNNRTSKLWQQELSYVKVLGVDKKKSEKTTFYANGRPQKSFVREYAYDTSTGYLIRINTRETVQGV